MEEEIMKKTIIVTLCVVLALVMCACGGKGQSVGVPLPPEPTQAETNPVKTEPEKIIPTETTPEETIGLPNENVFFNDSNNFYDADQVTIRPRHMYWEGNTLVAECFVINGKNVPVYNLIVDQLMFANEDGTIVDGAFGNLQNAVVGPYSHILWTFRFSGDAVEMVDGDLQSITYRSRVKYSH